MGATFYMHTVYKTDTQKLITKLKPNNKRFIAADTSTTKYVCPFSAIQLWNFKKCARQIHCEHSKYNNAEHVGKQSSNNAQ